MIKIFHNPRCKKSREGLAILENSGKKFEVIKYLEDIPTKDELGHLVRCLAISPENLVRKTETVWKENFKGKLLSDGELLDIMIANPKLIERPIVINGNKAVIGRPSEKIAAIL